MGLLVSDLSGDEMAPQRVGLVTAAGSRLLVPRELAASGPKTGGCCLLEARRVAGLFVRVQFVAPAKAMM